jgi:uncharacterized protein (TIGR02453 family)
MKNACIQKSTLDFLKSLSKNNNRNWFNNNKERYLREYEKMIAFSDMLLLRMNGHDLIENQTGKDCLFRIYNDIRFSKDKTPYKTDWAGGFKRATPKRRGGYYYQIEPGNSYAAGGFFSPNPEDVKRIRQDIDVNYTDWNKLLSKTSIKKTFGTLLGEEIATAPRGYTPDHPAIKLLRHKRFYLKHRFTDAEVLDAGFLNNLNNTFKQLRPFFDYMSDVLTTDLNGESII